MTEQDGRARSADRRWSVLPRLLHQAPPRVLILVGVLLVVLGVFIVTRPLTSLLLLGVYVGISAIASGILELGSTHRAANWWTRGSALAWVVLGTVILVWVGRSLNLLPPALAVLLLLGGVASLADAATRPRRGVHVPVSKRVLSACWGGAQIAFGLLSLVWPNVTVLVVAVVFGVRTVVFGISLVVRAAAELNHRARRSGRAPGPKGRRVRLRAAGRYVLSVFLVVITATGWTLNTWLQDGTPVVDAFYDPPAVLPVGHGELIRTDDYTGTLPPAADVKRILYTTTDSWGDPVAASALVIIPHTIIVQAHPVVLWNHGTTGVARGCAPSLRDASATRWAIPGLDEALKKGWMVVAPDYTGQGAPGTFPYLIGQGEGRSGLDAVRAAQKLPHLWASDDVVVWGHSQGGHAALWATKIAPDYAPELNVLGTAALAPAGDPLSLAKDLTAGFANVQLTVLTAWVLIPYSQTYPDVLLSDYVSPGGRVIVREMAQRCPSEPGAIVSVLAALGISENGSLYIGDLTQGALGRRLAQNAADFRLDSPVLMAWGSRDEVIPRSEQVAFAKRLCAKGDRVQWSQYPGIDHIGILQPTSPFPRRLIDWSDDLFAHRAPPADQCP